MKLNFTLLGKMKVRVFASVHPGHNGIQNNADSCKPFSLAAETVHLPTLTNPASYAK